MENTEQKEENLKKYLKDLKSAVLAYSGGVDSTYLLKIAFDVLGGNITAITIKSESFPLRELKEAVDFCQKENIRQIIINSSELEIEGFSKNPPDRCYLCKKELFTKIISIANENNIQNILEGSNADDINDYRPGRRAIKELNIKSPLLEMGFSKQEIRILSKKHNLPTYSKPSFACLASRFVYGETITKEKLKMVGDAEQLLFNLGFIGTRVRIHGTMARIEIAPSDFEKIIKKEIREEITKKLKEYGFTYVSLDLEGYRTGSMNEIL